jgi:DNA-binding NarL/FixJ family response regulator
MEPIRVLIADDHSVVRQGIESALEEEPEFEVIGTAGDGAEALEKVAFHQPDIVIMDISMPGMSGVDAAYKIRDIDERIQIVVFSMFCEEEFVLQLFRVGVAAYVLKEEPMSDLILALKATKDGGNYYSKRIHEVLRRHMQELQLSTEKDVQKVQDGIATLSSREKEVFPLLADGLSIKEIADRLFISPKTVESHKYNIMEKLNVRSIPELTKLAIKKDLIKI